MDFNGLERIPMRFRDFGEDFNEFSLIPEMFSVAFTILERNSNGLHDFPPRKGTKEVPWKFLEGFRSVSESF